MNPTEKKTTSSLKKIALWSAVPLLIIVIIVAIFTPVRPVSVSIATLNAEYDQSESAAKDKYEGKALTVIGVITDTGEDSAGRSFVILSNSVQSTMKKNQEAIVTTLKKGDIIKLSAVCTGKLGYILMRDGTVIR